MRENYISLLPSTLAGAFGGLMLSAGMLSALSASVWDKDKSNKKAEEVMIYSGVAAVSFGAASFGSIFLPIYLNSRRREQPEVRSR